MPLIIISGPSGAGEDSIIEGIAARLPIERVTTTTTRQPREGESEGHPYYFISKEEFRAGIEAGKFFEYAEQYNGNLYGVTRDEIERVQESDNIGIWKIEYQGVMQAKQEIPGIKAILISAPLDQMEERIRHRDEATEEFIADRMAYTQKWLNHKDLYDFEVVNEDGKLEESIDTAEDIIRGIAGLDK